MSNYKETGLVGWPTYSGLLDAQNGLDRALGRLGFLGETDRWVPALNAWLSDDTLTVSVEVPGVDPKDVDISIVNDELTISGKRATDVPEKVDSYRCERAVGEFARRLELPFVVDSAKVAATCKNGVLTITLHRAEQDKPKKIAIQTA